MLSIKSIIINNAFMYLTVVSCILKFCPLIINKLREYKILFLTLFANGFMCRKTMPIYYNFAVVK